MLEAHGKLFNSLLLGMACAISCVFIGYYPCVKA